MATGVFYVQNSMYFRGSIQNDTGSFLTFAGGTSGVSRFLGNVEIGYGSASQYYLSIGESRSGNGYAFLDLVGDATYTDYGFRIIRGNSGANTTTHLYHRGTGDLVVQTDEAAQIVFLTNSTDRGRITSGGEWWMGYTSDQGAYLLQVNGTIYASGDVIAYSDVSVKTNVRNIDNALDRVLKSRGVLYDRIDTEDKDNIGFIAQELEDEFPELVATNNDGTKAVKYQNAVAVLFEAIKEQQKEIEKLKNKL
jgi:hypothetical protein